MFKPSAKAAILSVVTVGAMLSFDMAVARAGDNVTEDQIIKALTPEKKPLTRGLSVGPQTSPGLNADQAKFVQSVRGRATRSLSSTEREEIATIVQDKPKIDLEINFDYNSADISAKSLPSVQALGRALTNQDLKGSTFVVAGHTDAAGGEEYNQGLSERRADASSAISSTNTASAAPTWSPSAMARASSRTRATRWRTSTGACRSSTSKTRTPHPNDPDVMGGGAAPF